MENKEYGEEFQPESTIEKIDHALELVHDYSVIITDILLNLRTIETRRKMEEKQ